MTAKWQIASAGMRIVGRGKTCHIVRDVICMGTIDLTAINRESQGLILRDIGVLIGQTKQQLKVWGSGVVQYHMRRVEAMLWMRLMRRSNCD